MDQSIFSFSHMTQLLGFADPLVLFFVVVRSHPTTNNITSPTRPHYLPHPLQGSYLWPLYKLKMTSGGHPTDLNIYIGDLIIKSVI